MKVKSLAALVLVIILVCAVMAGCGTEDTGEMVKLTVSEVTHSVFYAPQYAALALGYFADEGLDVELINGGGADNVMTSVITGEVEIGLSGPEACIYTYNEGKQDHAIVFAQLTKRDGSFLMGREKNDDFTYEDVRGKHVIGGRKGGVPNLTLEYVLRNNGLTLDDYHMDTSIEFSLTAAAFASGTGDYVTVFEPTATMMENEGQGYIVSSIGQDSGEIPYTAYYANKSYIEQNPEVIQKFTNAIYRGQQWIEQTDAAEVAQVLLPFFSDSDVEVLKKVVTRYREIDAWCKDPIMTEDALTRLQDVMESGGELSRRAPYTDLVTTTFAEKAMQS